MKPPSFWFSDMIIGRDKRLVAGIRARFFGKVRSRLAVNIIVAVLVALLFRAAL